MKILTFTLNDICFGISVNDVISIESRTVVEGEFATSGYVRGIIMLYGMSVRVCSLAVLFGFPECEIKNLIVVNSAGIKLALEVESVNEIVDVDEEDFLPFSPCINIPPYLKNVAAFHRKQLISLINVNGLVPQGDSNALD